jgi:hypothetical protein
MPGSALASADKRRSASAHSLTVKRGVVEMRRADGPGPRGERIRL